jgi:hypothetical protein
MLHAAGGLLDPGPMSTWAASRNTQPREVSIQHVCRYNDTSLLAFLDLKLLLHLNVYVSAFSFVRK